MCICGIWMYQYNFCTLNTHNWVSWFLICPNRWMQYLTTCNSVLNFFNIWNHRGSIYKTFINLFFLKFATMHPSSDHLKIDWLHNNKHHQVHNNSIHHFCILGPSLYTFICFHCLAQLEEWPKGGGKLTLKLCITTKR